MTTTLTEPIRVAIVDDMRSARHGLRAALGTFPEIAIVGEAEDGRKAVTVALERRPHVVLMDIRMPGMNGIEACRLIKETNPDIGVVLMTIHADSAFESRAEGDAVLLKGCSLETLMRVLREVALRHRPFRERKEAS